MDGMTAEEERALIEACAKAMGYEVTDYVATIGAQFVAGSEDESYTDYFNPLHSSLDCAEMEDAKDVSVIHFKFCVEAISAYFSITENYPDNPTIEQKSAARRLAVCRCVAASVKEK